MVDSWLLVDALAFAGAFAGGWLCVRLGMRIEKAKRQAARRAEGVCDHVWIARPVEQNRNGYRIFRCEVCGDETARAGTARWDAK